MSSDGFYPTHLIARDGRATCGKEWIAATNAIEGVTCWRCFLSGAMKAAASSFWGWLRGL